MRAVSEAAVASALAAGAGYADARAVERRTQHVSTRNGQVETVDDSETAGIGVRVLVDGAWGFACDRRLDVEGARDAALHAVAFARASARATRRRVELAPLEPQTGEYRTPAERDPIEVPLDEKGALCLRAEAGLAGGKGRRGRRGVRRGARARARGAPGRRGGDRPPLR